MRLSQSFTIFLATLLVILFSSCSANLDVAVNQQVPSPIPTVDVNAAPNRVDPTENMTVGQLLSYVENTSPSSYCAMDITLNNNDKSGLEKVRRRWLRSEDDDRYRLAKMYRGPNKLFATNCVCPSICVVTVIDTRTPAPNNYSVLVFTSDSPKDGYVWAARNLDLTKAQLGFHSSTAYLLFFDDEGKNADLCDIKGTGRKYSCGFYGGHPPLF